MRTKLLSILSVSVVLSFSSCSNKTIKEVDSKQMIDSAELVTLSESQAAKILSLPVHCLEVEYPNKLGQVIGSAADLKTPKELRPIFYGCFDWHSSVHGYWSIVELLQKFPDLVKDKKIRAMLNKHITAANVSVELAFFNDPNNKSFERTYGWAWLFKLQESLIGWQDEDAQRWAKNLQPLVDEIVARYIVYLPKQTFPLRVGQHNNSAFGLSLSLDYARSLGDSKFEEAIISSAKAMFINDKDCNLAYEPSGHDFLSPCFEEAYLMSKVLPVDEYRTWLKAFLPSLFDKTLDLKPVSVTDRTDGHLVHLDGLNYSKAACLYGIAEVLPELSYLKSIANEHIAFSLPYLSVEDDYMGSHWLGTFALYALDHAK